MIKLVIFDLDGTLVNAYPAVAQSVNFTLQKLGYPKKTFHQIKRAVGWGDRQLMAQFVGEKFADKAIKIYRPHHLKALRKGVHFLPGASGILKWCKKNGLMLAIATNRPTTFTHSILKGLGVDKIFDRVLCGDKLKKAKPDPDILFQICKALKVEKQEVIFVGDMTIDLNCGARAGIKTIGVATGSNTKKELKELKPYKIIDKISQLKQVALLKRRAFKKGKS